MIFVKAQFTWICSQTQLVFTSLTCNTKEVVFSVSCFSSRLFKIHMKPASFFCQSMNLVQSEPKLTIQISKASFVVIPASVEINRAIQSLLEHCPPPTVCRLVTIHIEGTCIVGVDGVDTAFPFTSFVEFSTVLVNFKDMINICTVFFQALFSDSFTFCPFKLFHSYPSGGTLRDDTKNGCVADYSSPSPLQSFLNCRWKVEEKEEWKCTMPFLLFFHYSYFSLENPVGASQEERELLMYPLDTQ